MLTEIDIQHLQRCVALAADALNGGNEPFGSVLVSADGHVLAEDHNRTASGDPTLHPEFQLARWAAANLTSEARAAATVYTSGEHCPMCSAAHGLVGLGRIVYASSAEQLASWRSAMGLPPGRVNNLPIQAVVPGIEVDGPAPVLAEQIHSLHRMRNQNRKQTGGQG